MQGYALIIQALIIQVGSYLDLLHLRCIYIIINIYKAANVQGYALIIQALIIQVGSYLDQCGHHDIGLTPSNLLRRSIHLKYTSSILTLALTHRRAHTHTYGRLAHAHIY